MSKSKKVQRDIIQLMRSTGVRPELIYAYEQTGILADEEGYKKLSAADRADYDRAIDAYLAREDR